MRYQRILQVIDNPKRVELLEQSGDIGIYQMFEWISDLRQSDRGAKPYVGVRELVIDENHPLYKYSQIHDDESWTCF